MAPKDQPAALAQYSAAIAKFQRAAALDKESPDPFLGMGRIYLEPRGLNDVDRGVAAIQEAERRGHVIGWRQRADIGHAYRVRADRYRQEDDRDWRRMQRGASRRLGACEADYERCVEFLEPDCRSGAERVTRLPALCARADRSAAAEASEPQQVP